jgi:hypothetical protein
VQDHADQDAQQDEPEGDRQRRSAEKAAGCGVAPVVFEAVCHELIISRIAVR